MALILFTKPPASAAKRVAHLKARGLVISRPSVAAKKIEMIGYERLRIYFLSRRQNNVQGRPFLPNTTYRDILDLYECDARIRDACFSAVGQFELLLRNSVAEHLTSLHGSHPYDLVAFKNSTSHLDAMRTFIDVYGKSKDQRAKHYRAVYGAPALPPIWTMKEFLTFGATSRVFQTLAGPIRTAVAKEFGVSKDTVFENWLECMVDLRNICAHHDRLFNRSFQKQPATLVAANIPVAPSQKLKAILECLDYVLTKRGVASDVTTKVGKLVSRYPAVRPAEAGY
jgi:abortive infection bacteriophage resistance protein